MKKKSVKAIVPEVVEPMTYERLVADIGELLAEARVKLSSQNKSDTV